MRLSAEQTAPTRIFEMANAACAVALWTAAWAFGRSDLLPGAVLGSLVAAFNVRLTRRILERFLSSESKDQGAASALLGGKFLLVLACTGALVYLRPGLAPGMALGFSSILPASLVLAAGFLLHRLE